MVDNQVYGSYIDAFRACHRSRTHPEDFYTDPDPESEASDGESDGDPEERTRSGPSSGGL